MTLAQTDAEYYADANYYAGVTPARERSIDFIDPTPKQIEIQIPLVEYFERTRRLKADRWQNHFCNYLQNAVATRHEKPTWAEFHAEAQLGKTTILSQAFKAWCIGHDPLWRAILAMYNVSRSEAHSQVIIQILQSTIHKDIFPNKDGHLPSTVSKEGWSTNARKELNDGQHTFNPVGLQSGMTGSGFDWLTIDDPYKEPKDAFSATVFDNLERFWTYGVVPRLSAYSCIAAMFHRYAYDDFGGYLLNTGKFDYVRYATVADGPYVHDETGQKFEDPLDRNIGEYISPDRRPPSYYDDKRGDTKVWNSMFQGRPSSVEGDFFKVAMLGTATAAEWALCTLKGRGWDHAATADAGDKSAGGLMGMLPDGTAIVADVFSGQLDSAARVAKQRELAEQDGADVTVVIPKDKAAAGKDVVFMTEQALQGFTVVARDVTNAAPGSDAKRRRAYNLSVAVNSGKVKFMEGSWNDRIKRLMRNFGASASGDDEIDALSDVYNHLYEENRRGLVVKFGQEQIFISDGQKIAKNWTVYAGLKISPDATMPNTGVIIARAADNTGLKDALFIIAEYKQYTDDYKDLFKWLDLSLKTYCESPDTAAIYLHDDSADYVPTIKKSFGNTVYLFNESPMAGVTEANWYLQEKKLTALIRDPQQFESPTNALGLVATRQEAATWGFTDKGVPNGIGQVWDCIRMISYAFRTRSTGLTKPEQREAALPASLQNVEEIMAMEDVETAERKMLARTLAFNQMDKKEESARAAQSKYRPSVPRMPLRRRF